MTNKNDNYSTNTQSARAAGVRDIVTVLPWGPSKGLGSRMWNIDVWDMKACACRENGMMKMTILAHNAQLFCDW